MQEEVYVILEGGGRMRLDEEIIDVRAWDAVRVAPEVIRAFEGGPDGNVVLAIGGPRPVEGDGDILHEPWPGDS